MGIHKFATALCLTALFSHSLYSAELDTQRLQFLDAERYYKLGQTSNYNLTKNKLLDYPLYPYLVYEELNSHIKTAGANEVRLFLYRFADTPLADTIRKKYLLVLANNGKWQEYTQFYDNSDNDKYECLNRKALYLTNQKKSAFKGIDTLWLTGQTLSTSCNYIIDKAFSENRITTDLLIERIKLAISSRNIRLAHELSGNLTDSKKLKQQIQDAHHFPLKYINNYREDETAISNYLYIHALNQLSRKDLKTAMAIWAESNKSDFDQTDIARLERRMSAELYSQRGPLADKIVEFNNNQNDSGTLESLVRLNLATKNWQQVIHNLDAFSNANNMKEEWLYWRARSLEKLGNYIQAYRIYEDISDNRSYYGFVSADKIQRQYQLNTSTIDFNDSDLESIEKNAYFQRAREFYALGRTANGRRELLRFAENLADDDLYKLAQLAHNNSWHDVAILIISKTPYSDDLNIRFPIINIENEDNLSIDKAWVLATIRQESLFMHDAMSDRGAIGLMQILPGTAHHVAKGTSLKNKRNFKATDLLDKEKNIILGSSYLYSNLKRFNNNPVLASAAYNAGPTNVSKWLPNQSLDADIWIETIPFLETRDYVRRVLTYTSIYERKLGITATKITDRMPEVGTLQ